MATTLFARSDVLDFQPASVGPTTNRQLRLTRGAATATQTDNTVASLSAATTGVGASARLWAGTNNTSIVAGVETNLQSGLLWVSNPLNAVTIAGNITVNVRALESNAMANYCVGAFVYRVTAAGVTNAKIGAGVNGTELGTVDAATSVTITPTSTALAAGDRVALAIWYQSATATVSAATFTASGTYSGTTGAAAGDTFITFTETITERPVRPEVTLMQAVQRAATFCWAETKKSGILVPRIWTPDQPAVICA